MAQMTTNQNEETKTNMAIRRFERLHFNEVAYDEADTELTATRYFPISDVSLATQGVDHINPLLKKLTALGWKETKKLQEYMYQGRKTTGSEYKRGRSYLMLTVYREDLAAWCFVRIRGVGSDVTELRDWMQTYETKYGRLRE